MKGWIEQKELVRGAWGKFRNALSKQRKVVSRESAEKRTALNVKG